jgi:hypothetical protein
MARNDEAAIIELNMTHEHSSVTRSIVARYFRQRSLSN